jgi:hypothetical protein
MSVRGETTAIVPCQSSLVPRHLLLAPTATDLGNDPAQVCAPGDAHLKLHRAGMKLPCLRRGAAVEMDVATWQKRSVDNVHTFGFGSGRTGAVLGRIRYVFREFPVFARAGMRFESHLGTADPLVGGDFALTCVQSLWWCLSDARRGLWPGRRGGLFRCVGGGFRVLAGGPSACCVWVYAVPRSGSVCLVVDGQHLFMVRGCGHNMTSPTLVRKPSWGSSHASQELYVLGMSCQSSCGHCPHLCLLL